MTKILIVEDEEPMRMSMSIILKRGGYEVDEAADGEEGFERARGNVPDLIVSDIEMPRLGGYELLKRIRLEKSLSSIPFVFLTGKGEKPDIRKGMEKGADDYITKPFHAEELLKAIETRLKKHAAILEQSEKKLGDLRGSISLALPHELRTPLTGILGFADLLIEGADELKPGETAEMGTHIKASAARLHRVIENFLIYAQIEVIASDEGRVKLLRQQRLAKAGTLIGLLARKKAREYDRIHDLRVDVHDGEAGISQEYLTRIIDELADNAFKFSAAGTKVSVTSIVDKNEFVLTIADRGRGMTQEQIASLGAYLQFDRKFHEQQGTGLGLTIAKRLTEIFGGRMELDNRSEQGLTVHIYLPLSRVQ